VHSFSFTTGERSAVVDNASKDLSLERCTEHFPEEPKLKIIRNTTNLGFAAACNISIAQATES